LGGAKRSKAASLGLQHHVELAALDLGSPGHVGHVGIDLAASRQGLTRRTTGGDIAPKVERNISVGTEARARAAIAGAGATSWARSDYFDALQSGAQRGNS
jgi:hypothetical protein